MTLFTWLDADRPTSPYQSYLGQVFRSLRNMLTHPLVRIGLLVLLPLVVLSVAAAWISPYDPYQQNLAERLLPPSGDHLFGTDQLGRDIFRRTLAGGQVTLAIVVAAAASVLPIGLLVGIVAGYRGGAVEAVLMRITDISMSFPQLVLALALAAALGPGIENAIIAISLTAWPPFARLARAETKRLRGADFIAASKLQGASTARIVLIDLLPLVLPTMLARLTTELAGMILTAAGLGFLGLGAQPPLAEWGAMVADGRDFLADQWWVSTLPGVAIFLVSFAVNLMGDGISEVMDPRQS